MLQNSATKAKTWVGEAGGAYNSGHHLASDSFVYSFWLVQVTHLCVVLKLPWTHMLPAVDNHCPWKAKCLSLQVLSKLGPNFIRELVLEVLDMGLHDEAKAVISMLAVVFWSTPDISSPILEKIEHPTKHLSEHMVSNMSDLMATYAWFRRKG
ncbi:hypothetical protein PIB30_048073 [Stylosanthes scabra]|uniref:Uncharacterized protein n=1 Tax=Stylosanthes scabra TaxID=79078 RepID=A0ABU6UKA5_9FABA|nr:hypothetical protein [Stylosanthes scabra]